MTIKEYLKRANYSVLSVSKEKIYHLFDCQCNEPVYKTKKE